MPVARYANSQPPKGNAKSVTLPRLTVTAAARELGVHRVHLSRVLHGHRTSRSLTERYHALRARYAAASA